MSSWKSSPSGRRPSSARYGERTPLRSLENDTQHLSSPSPRKALLHANAERETKDASLCDPESPLLSPFSISFAENGTITALGHGEETFQSFNCAGGEVEISQSSVCATESIVFLEDQIVNNASETEDTVISDSLIVQSCGDHMEHPYCKPELKEASFEDINAECLDDIPEISQSTEHLDGNHLTQENNTQIADENITWKSFACHGGEVELSDVTKSTNITFSLLNEELDSIKDLSIDSSYPFDVDLVCQTEHADHPYYRNEKILGNSVIVSEATNSCEKPADGLSDVTFKSLNCTGGEIELSEGIAVAEETIPLQVDQLSSGNESLTHDIDPSLLVGDHNVLHSEDHLDHPYCNIENILRNGKMTAQKLCDHDALDEMEPNEQTLRQEDISPASVNCNQPKDEPSEGLVTTVTETTSPLLNESAQVYQHMSKPAHVAQDHAQKIREAEAENRPPSLTNTPSRSLDEESVHVNVKETPKNISIHHDDDALPSMLHKTTSSDLNYLVASAAELQQLPQQNSQEQSNSEIGQHSEVKDSALGSSGNGPIHCNSADKAIVETLPDVLKLLSETPSIAPALQFGILSPVIKRVSQSLKARRDAVQEHFLADDSVFNGEKSFVAPVNVGQTGLWTENLESPMPRPLFNSTVLGSKTQRGRVSEQAQCFGKQPFVEPQAEAEQPDVPLITDGPLQQQLRQMAEFLMLASGKMGLAGVSDPIPTPAPPAPTKARTIPVKTHSVCVATTPVKMVDHSLNTSGHFERKRDFSVMDACTLTDPLLWNVPPGSLECLPKQELELRLRSSMIMVEALVQQLAVARAHGRTSMGPPPSELREKVVQTDHTELSQTTMYRDLYVAALKRVGDLELDEDSLQNLRSCMQGMRVTMTSLHGETGAALSDMKKIETFVRDDHQSLVSHYAEMKSLFEKSKETQTRMMQRVKDALQQRECMKLQMEEALTAKESAFDAMEQLRTHCATEISELQKSVGSQQELLSAVNTTYTEQFALNQANSDVLNSASELLAQTIGEQSFLTSELCNARSLLRKTAPLLLQLNEKAASALRERDQHISDRDQALEEREQMEEELNQATLSLQTSREQIGDLNLQVTILTSEMGVLRQKLTEREEERAQLERKVTEMSATVSSTMASHTFMEHALAAETAKLLDSQKEMSQVNERADELEATLCQSEQRVCELGQALAEREDHLGRLQELSQSQRLQIQELQDVCTQLNGMREMNEFLQMENELARDQVSESEQMLRVNLQSLRERNIQCEDLKGELGQLQLEHRSLQEQLETQKVEAGATLLELKEKLAQAVTEITLLHHTLRGATNALHAALNEEKSDAKNDTESQPVHMERRHPSSSFVDRIMVALASDKEEHGQMETPAGPVPSDLADSQTEALFSQTSAFTRIAAVTPKKMLSTQDFEPDDEQTCVAELLAYLGSTVTELVTNLKSLQQRKESELEELRNTIFGLKVEQEAANGRHEAEVIKLKQLISRLNGLVEKGNQALQQKAQDEKMITSLVEELNEAQELITKLKTDNNEVRKELSEIRQCLQQSQAESQFLRKELRNPGGLSADPEHLLEEKIQQLKEVERLKLNLQEAEQARVKLLERAKRHQIIHQTNQQKSENELQMLSNMINKVRETLLCLPEVVKNCEQLQQLVEYIG